MTLNSFYKHNINSQTKEIKALKKKILQTKMTLRELRTKGEHVSELEREFFNSIQERKGFKEDMRILYLAYATLRNQDLSKVEPKTENPVSPERIEQFMKRMEVKFSN